ncbi:hypothetical protein [Natronomonas marina]|jgi:hypothetical protein|uniref:hypothetical protein n=1 Tax=Natronomonas marina TaxID=2961939 RepID=UPI0020CA09E6|nr:hypothetical protein [Natronomonas marina]
MDALLHTGIDHPNVWWIVVPSMLSFLVGLVAFVFSARIRAFLGLEEPVAE